MPKFNAFRPTLNAMEDRSLMSATFTALPAPVAEPAHPVSADWYFLVSSGTPAVHTGMAMFRSAEQSDPATSVDLISGRVEGIAVDPSDPSAEGGITKLGSRRLILQGDGSYGDDPAADAGILTNGDTTSEGRRDLNDIYVFQSPTNPAGQSISGSANLVRFNSSTPGTSAVSDDVIVDGRIITAQDSSVARAVPLSNKLISFKSSDPNTLLIPDDVIVDGRIITAQDTSTASSHDLGHALGFRHEHTRPEAQTQGDVIGGWGNDWISGGTGQDGTSANAGDPAPYQGRRSNGGYVPT